MNKEHAIYVHWTSKYQPMVMVLYDDHTWEEFVFPKGTDYLAIKTFMNLRICTQKRMCKKEVQNYIDLKIKELKES